MGLDNLKGFRYSGGMEDTHMTWTPPPSDVDHDSVRTLSCGCCSRGCVCWNHQDTPRGRPPYRVPGHAVHRETSPIVTESLDALACGRGQS